MNLHNFKEIKIENLNFAYNIIRSINIPNLCFVKLIKFIDQSFYGDKKWDNFFKQIP